MTKLAVIIPCYDGAHTLGPTLVSLANQTRVPDEVIVCDDGSTDDSVAVARAYGATVHVGPFGGAGAARNHGLARTDADHVMFLDADDVILPDTLEHLERALPEGGFARCEWRRYDYGSEAWIVTPQSCAPRAPWQDDLSAWLMGWYCPPCAILWTRAALDAAGPWCEDRRAVNEDGELVMRALTAGCPLARAEGGTALYRRPGFGEVTVSGRRFGEDGLTHRLIVIDEVRARLEAQERAGAYALALADAYRDVADDAKQHPEIAAEAEAKRAALGVGRAALRAEARARRVAAGRRWPTAALTERAPQAPSRADPSEPLVSVVVPTYRRPAETVAAVRSVLSQDHGHLEVIVVDDASGDDTAERVDALGDDRVRVLTQPENRGVAAARNAGMAAAKGDLFAFLDSDDYWLDGKLSRQVAALARAGGRGRLCVTSFELRRGGDVLLSHTPPTGDVFAALLGSNVLRGAASSALVGREVYEMIGGFDTSLTAAEDWDFFLRATRFFDVVTVPEVLTVQTDEEGPRRSRAVPANLTARDAIHARYAPDMRRAGVETAFLMETARRRLSEEGGDPRAGRATVLRALRTQAGNPRLYPWLGYMMAPSRVRRALRGVDGRDEPRPI